MTYTQTESIADQILIELKQKFEPKRLQEKYEEDKILCLKFMQDKFDKKLAMFEKWEEDAIYSYNDNYSLPTDFESFISIVESLGFKVGYNDRIISYSVPKLKKGKKASPAQDMLYKHIADFNEKLKEIDDEINRVWDSIKERKFHSEDNDDGTFTIMLPLTKTRYKEVCDEKLLEFLSDNEFPNATINDNILSIVLG